MRQEPVSHNPIALLMLVSQELVRKLVRMHDAAIFVSIKARFRQQ